MFSKSFCAVLALVGTLGIAGCSLKLGEEPPPPNSQEFGGTKCLSETKPVVKAFIQGEAQVVEIRRAWDCISSAVEKFKRYVRGRESDSYTAQELATFLEDNFLNPQEDPKISAELQHEFMKLKMVFVGGNAQFITRPEIDRLITLFSSLRNITVDLNPYMKIVAMNWPMSGGEKVQKDLRFFEEANLEIQKAAKTLATIIEENGQSYLLSDFVTLMNLMGDFFGEEWTFPQTINKYMPVIKSMKTALAGGDEDLITPKEWRRFAVLGARGYVLYLRYFYFIQSAPETGSGIKLSYLARTAEDLLSVFEDLVAEKPAGVISKAEVTSLLESLGTVWPEFKTSPGLVTEAMKVKQLFFGGGVNSFTREDFERARLKVGRLKNMAERFLPYYLIYVQEWNPDFYERAQALTIFSESQVILEATLREAGILFEGSYDLQDARALLREVEALYPPENTSYEKLLADYLPLIVDTKNMVLGGKDSSLHRGQWSVLLGFAAKAYSDFLFYDYFLKDRSWKDIPGVQAGTIFINQSLDILRDLLGIKESKAFSRAELTTIVNHLGTLKIIPKLSQNSSQRLMDVLLNHILVEPELRLAGRRPNALNLASIETLRRELNIFLELEQYIAGLTNGWPKSRGILLSEYQQRLSRAQRTETSPNLRVALNEMNMIVNTSTPMTFDDQWHLIISNRRSHQYNQNTMTQLNVHRLISRLLMRSFVGDRARMLNYLGVTLPEVEAAFELVRPLVVELDFLDEKNVTFANSRFREANIFVPHADGNNLASFTELTDLIGMIISGLNINTKLAKDLSVDCFDGRPLKKNSTTTLTCIRSSYKKSMRKHMTATPEYLTFMGQASNDEWAYYMNNVFKAAGYIPNSKNVATADDISLAPHVIQYIEMIFARFDQNKDGFISTEESLAAFPAFKGILLELAAGQVKEEELLDLFTYILRYGKPPTTVKEKLSFVFRWKGKPHNWDVWANRVQLSIILGYIADQTTAAATQPPPQDPSVSNYWSDIYGN